jgi:hypothetical protein
MSRSLSSHPALAVKRAQSGRRHLAQALLCTARMTHRACFGLLFALSACSVQTGLGPPTNIGPAGGKITVEAKSNSPLAGTSLVVPAGAIPEATAVAIQAGDELATGSVVALGPSVRIEPTALQLAVPAKLYLPYKPSAQPSSSYVWVAWRHGDNTSMIGSVLVATSLGLAQISITGFGDFEVVASPCGDIDLGGTEDIAYVQHDLAGPAADLAPSSTPDFAVPPDGGGSGSGTWDGGSSQPDLGLPSSDGGNHIVDCYDGGATATYAPAPYCVYSSTTDLAVP